MAEWPNPYVGPREIRQGENIYGRGRESTRLMNLLIAERIVLLSSPSGAGKTSLIQASLIPALRGEGFQILGPIRVNHALDFPANTPENSPPVNRHILSVLQDLEKGREDRLETGELVRLNLVDYLDQRFPTSNDGVANLPFVLIFDQFEEILTSDPNNFAAKMEFFVQLGKALSNRQRWALFSMREDYRAALDPFLRPVPTHFANTFRLDFLNKGAAKAAIQRPASGNGVDFGDEAAQKLVDDLAPETGEYIEPVQLQLVCFRLWEKLKPDWTELSAGEPQILPDDIEETGDVNGALADYYSTKVREAATTLKNTDFSERKIRDWFGNELISDQNTREQVRLGTTNSRGLPNQILPLLKDAYLVRSEERGNRTYYELAHDRLIKPIRDDNEAFYKTLHAFQQQAKIWSTDRSPSRLLRGDALEEALNWEKANASSVTELEREFLKECSEARDAAIKESTLNRRIRFFAVFASIVSVLVIFLAMWIWRESQISRHEGTRSAVRELAAQSQLKASKQFDLALLLSLQSVRMHNQQIEEIKRLPMSLILGSRLTDQLESEQQATGQLANLAKVNPYINTFLHGHTDLPFSLAWSPNGNILACGYGDGKVALWDTRLKKAPQAAETNYKDTVILSAHKDTVWHMAFSADSKFLAMGSLDHTVSLWDVAKRQRIWASKEILDPKTHKPLAIRAIALSPDGHWFAAGDMAGNITCWDRRNWKHSPIKITTTGNAIHSLAWTPLNSEPMRLASGDDMGKVALWDLTKPDDPVREWTNHDEPVNSLVFRGDGKMLASAGGDSLVVLCDPDTGKLFGRGLRPDSAIYAMAISPDGRMLVTGGADQVLTVWDTKTNQKIGDTLVGHNGNLTDITFHPDGKMVVSCGWDGNVILWNLPVLRHDQTQNTWRWDSLSNRRAMHSLKPADSIIRGVRFMPGDKEIVSLDDEGNLVACDTGTYTKCAQILSNNVSIVMNVSYSPDGKLLAAGQTNGQISLWDMRTRRRVRILSGHTEKIEALAWRYDGKVLATSSDDDTIRLWNVSTGKTIGEPLLPRADNVNSVAFSPDGKMLAAGCADGAGLEFWGVLYDLSGNHPVMRPPLLGHKNEVRAVAWSSDGKILATGDADGNIFLWNMHNKMQPVIWKKLVGYGEGVRTLAFSPDIKQNLLASAGEDGNILLWGISKSYTASPLGVLKGRNQDIWSIAFTHDGKYLASGGDSNSVQFWNLATRKLESETRWKGEHPFLTARVNSLAMSPDGKTFAVASNDWRLSLWSISDFLKQHTVERPIVALQNFKGWGKSLACSSDGIWIAVGRLDGTVTICNRKTGIITQLPAPDFKDAPLRKWEPTTAFCMDFQPGSTHLAVGYSVAHAKNDDGHLILWDVQKSQQLISLKAAPRYICSSVAFNHDGTMLATGHGNYNVTLWDYTEKPAPKLVPRYRMSPHKSAVYSVVFSPDDKTVASASKDGAIVLSDTKTGKTIASLSGHNKQITSLAYSPDGKFLASGSYDNTVCVWDVKSRQMFGQPFTEHSADIECLAWSHNGKFLASGSDDKNVIIRDFDPSHWKRTAEHLVNRNMYQTEWEQYLGTNTPYQPTIDYFPLNTSSKKPDLNRSKDSSISP